MSFLITTKVGKKKNGKDLRHVGKHVGKHNDNAKLLKIYLHHTNSDRHNKQSATIDAMSSNRINPIHNVSDYGSPIHNDP